MMFLFLAIAVGLCTYMAVTNLEEFNHKMFWLTMVLMMVVGLLI